MGILRTAALALLTTVVLLSLGTSSAAQQVGVDQLTGAGGGTETNRSPIIPFLEGTDVFWTIVRHDALDQKAVFIPNKLEGDIFPHLVQLRARGRQLQPELDEHGWNGARSHQGGAAPRRIRAVRFGRLIRLCMWARVF